MAFAEPHQLFHVPELVSIVCENVWESSDLARLARTSSTIFLEPALNVLWSEMTSFSALIRCFPTSLWEHTYTFPQKSLNFRRPIQPDDWTRFHYYAKRVRLLAFEDLESDKSEKGWLGTGIDHKIYQELEVASPGQSLFPNLLSLELDLSAHRSSFSYSWLNIFLNPRLEDLALKLGYNRELAQSFLFHLHSRCPNVEVLTIDSYSHHYREEVSDYVLYYRNLNTLTLPSIPTPKGLSHIARLENLISLTVNTIPHEGDGYLKFTANDRPFPNLEYLYLSVGPKVCMDFMKATVCSPLREISLGILLRGGPFGDENRAIIYASTLAHKKLEVLCIWETVYYQGLLLPSTQMADIEWLLKLSHLKQLILHLDGGLDFDDGDITKIAKALPGLEVLRLGPRGKRQPDPFLCRVTLVGVTSLIELCRDLKEASLRFDVTNIPNGPPAGIYNEIITELTVDDCPISHETEWMTARYLSGLLPKLEDICIDGDMVDDGGWVDEVHMKNWREVEKRLKKKRDERDEIRCL